MKPIHQIRILKRLRGGFGTAVILGILIPQLAVANPLGPQVVSGQASFATQGKILTVTNTNRTIINWQDFSVGNGELTRFIQPTATSAVLNRVSGNNPSAIYGALQSNGRVYLVNQNGIFIGPTATIDVNGLVASTLNITDGDFKAGKINFSGGPLAGRIKNQGAIRTPAGGSIYLIAPDVTNSGIINAPNGDILLAAGQQVSLVESTTPEIAVVISAPGNQILNLGRIIAEAGRIGIYGGLIQHRGIVSADSAVMDKTGAVHFRATNDITFDKDSRTTANGPQGGSVTVQSVEGTTLVSGAVETKGSSDKGGTIQLLGRWVGVIDAAQIDASGERGGGTVLVGGDYQGKNPAVQNADGTYFGADASIRADAVQSGDGGKVILWGNEATRSYGWISARGGEQSGNGGFVETSGKYLDYRGFADLRAPRGKTGTLLLDPTDIYIDETQPESGLFLETTPPPYIYSSVTSGASTSYIKPSTIVVNLASGNVLIKTAGGSGTPPNGGDITVSSSITWTSPNSLSLIASSDIAINAAITGTLGTLTLNAPGSISQTQPVTVKVLELLGGGTWSQVSATLPGLTVNDFRITSGKFIRALSGDGTTAPYQLADIYGVQGMGSTGMLGKSYALANNIDASSTSGWYSGAGFLPVGTSGNPFTGSFNGNSHNISGLYINRPATDYIGLFGYASGATIQNIGLSSTTITGKLFVGSLAGQMDTPTNNISNSYSASAAITGSGGFVGGLVGWIWGNISNSYSTGTATGTGATGGLTGGNQSGVSSISNSYSSMNVSGAGAGGLVGGNDGSISKSYSTGTVTGSTQAGGLVGQNHAGNISNSYSTGTVNGGGSTTAGGLVGLNGPYYSGGTTITNSYSTGHVSGDVVGGLVGSNAGTITSSYWDTQTSGQTASAGGTGKTTAEMKTQSTFVGWDFTGTWGIVAGSYPYLRGVGPPPTPTPPTPLTCPTGQELVGGICQPITCPAGQQLVGNTCQVVTCPTGQELVGNTCQAITCPTGQQLVGNLCQPIICPTGQQLVGNLCQPIICTGGQQLVGSLCACPGGQVFIGAGCRCPAGTIDYAGVCKTPSIVPGTDSSTVIYFPATEELGVSLQVLVQSIINTVNPSLFTTSGSPGGGAGDDLKPKKNYCN